MKKTFHPRFFGRSLMNFRNFALLTMTLSLPPLHALDVTWQGIASSVNSDWYAGVAGTDTGWDTEDFPAVGDHVILPSLPFPSHVRLGGTAAALGPLGSLRVGDVPIPAPVSGAYSPLLLMEGTADLSTTGNVNVGVGAGFHGEINWRYTDTATMLVGGGLTLGDGTDSSGILATYLEGISPITASLTVAADTFIARSGAFGSMTWEGELFQTGSLFIADVTPESNGQLNFGGQQMTVTSRFETGITGRGTFTSNGTFGIANLDTKDALFGVNEGSEGNATLGFTHWDLQGLLRVGLAGTASVKVNDDAFIQITTPDDFPSIVVGETATSIGSLSIEIYGDAGGGVEANHQAIIGLNATNAATAELRCGGSGSLTTKKHTSPSESSCIFGANANSSGRGDIENGGRLVGDGATVVGFFGTGLLIVSNYGSVDCFDLQVARQAGSSGEVIADSYGRLDLSQGCYIGGSPTTAGGTGTLTLDTDGELYVGSTLLIYAGSELRTRSIGDGRCLVGTDDFMTPILNDTVNLRTDGTVKGNGMIDGALLATGGRVEPGLSAGKLSVTKNVEMKTSSVLGIEIGGTTPDTQYDVLDSNATFTFSGLTVDVNLINSFVPSAGQTFKVIDALTYAGTTVTLDLTGAVLPFPLSWDTSTLTTDGMLRVSGTPTGGPVAIKAIRRIPGTDDIELTINGSAGEDYIVESSLNLLPPWSNISGTRIATGADELFVISGAVAADPKRFFRVAY